MTPTEASSALGRLQLAVSNVGVVMTAAGPGRPLPAWKDYRAGAVSLAMRRLGEAVAEFEGIEALYDELRQIVNDDDDDRTVVQFRQRP